MRRDPLPSELYFRKLPERPGFVTERIDAFGADSISLDIEIEIHFQDCLRDWMKDWMRERAAGSSPGLAPGSE